MQYKNVFFAIGIIITALYVVVLTNLLQPFDELKIFLSSANYNERGDFLAGIFGPIAFLWLIIGYFIQSSELSLQRQEIAKQYKSQNYQIELEKRKNDPEFNLEIDKDKITFTNVSNIVAKKVYVYYFSHENKYGTILGIANVIPPERSFTCSLEEWMPIPIHTDKESKNEIIIMYDTKMEDMRCQVWKFLYTSKDKNEIIGWQVKPSDQLPDYFK